MLVNSEGAAISLGEVGVGGGDAAAGELVERLLFRNCEGIQQQRQITRLANFPQIR